MSREEHDQAMEEARFHTSAERYDKVRGESYARCLLETIAPSEQLEREGMGETPARMAKALRELCSGYAVNVEALLSRTFPPDGYDGIVAVPRIRFASLCEHHVLPFVGTCSVAYVPGERIVGLSKIPRVVHAFARRLQVQERMTVQIADAMEMLKPKGIAVVIRAEHTCKSLRGVESIGDMVTSEMRGVFRNDATARAEVLALMEEA